MRPFLPHPPPHPRGKGKISTHDKFGGRGGIKKGKRKRSKTGRNVKIQAKRVRILA
jgi:hypothetical protein